MEDLVLDLGQETLRVAAMLASPVLLGALVAGLVISFLQAMTQMGEVTLSFVPKMIIVAIILALAAPWMLNILADYTENLFSNINVYVKELE